MRASAALGRDLVRLVPQRHLPCRCFLPAGMGTSDLVLFPYGLARGCFAAAARRRSRVTSPASSWRASQR